MNSGFDLENEMDESKGLNILVVDDDELNQRLLNFVLSRNGNAISFSYDGYDAVKLLGKERYDLIFMDIQIPRIDGFEVCEHVRNGDSLNKKAPIIALTAMPSRDTKLQDFLARGMFSECIHKPFDAEQIHGILASVAGNKKIGHDLVETAEDLPGIDLPVLNVEKVLPIFSDDISIYQQLFEDFFAKLPGRLINMRESEFEKDWKKLSRHAHNMTGITRNFGAEKLSALAQQLDEAAENENEVNVRRLIAEIGECVPELDEAYSSLINKES